MDTTALELELLELEELYKKTRNNIAKAELADKIKMKKSEIKKANDPILEKNIIPSREVPSRMDHSKNNSKTIVDTKNGFRALL